MTKNFTFLFFVLCIFSKLNISAETQQAELQIIKGKIYQKGTKKLLEEVVVGVKENNTITISDNKGEFEIQATIGQTLVFSKLGFKAIMEKISDETLSIFLEGTDEIQLDEVVVSARSNINDIDMRKLTSSIETIDMSKLSIRSEMDALRLLQGQVPGLVVTTSGELGAKPTIRIRGDASLIKEAAANEPLFVLDGVIISSDAFLALNPEDFDQIKVLKDATASALYGIKAAHGVIEISSKRGHKGKALITVSSKQGLTLRGPRGAEMMKTKEKLALEELLGNGYAPGYKFSEKYIRNEYSNKLTEPEIAMLIKNGKSTLDSLSLIDTDWFNELVRLNRYQSYSLGIKGGDEKSFYYYSLNYSNQGGRLEGNDIQRVSGRAALDYFLSKKFTVSLNFNAGLAQTNTPNGGDFDPGDLVYTLNPYETKKNALDGTPSPLYSYSNRSFADMFHQYEKKHNSNRFGASSSFMWEIMDQLSLSAVLGGDFLVNSDKSITPPSAFSQRNLTTEEKGILSESKGTDLNITFNIRANYEKSIDKHHLMLGANYDYYYEAVDMIDFKGYGIPQRAQTVKNVNQASRAPNIGGIKSKQAQLGFGASAGYTYNMLYDLYGSFKYDASSLFPEGKRGNTAWSLGGGWNVNNYDFLKKNKILTKFKIKGSYGYTSSLAGISPASTVPTFTYSTLDYYAKGRVFEMNSLYNDNLKPQKVESINIGLDFSFLNRLNLGLDLYRNETKDAVMSVPMQPSVGFSDIIKNIGVVRNSGFEIKVGGDIIDADNFRWNVSTSVSWNKNVVVALYDKKAIYLDSKSFIPDMEVGHPINTIYGLHSLGINSIDGLPRYLSPTGKELDPTSNFTRDDFVMLGYSTPPYTGFFNTSFIYKEFSLSAEFYFTLGGVDKQRYNLVRDRISAHYNAIKGQTKDMWFNTGDENKAYMSPFTGGVYDIIANATTKDIYKTDFLKLSNIRFNYRLTAQALASIGNPVSHCSFYAEAQNIFTLRRETDKGSLISIEQPVVTLGISIML